MASNSVFTAEKTEIGEIESFSVRRTGWETWDASLPWDSLADCIQVVTQAYAMPPGSIARGTVYQVQTIPDNYRAQSILQWLDTEDRTYVLSFYYDELPSLASVLSDLATYEGLPLDLDMDEMEWRNFSNNVQKIIDEQPDNGLAARVEALELRTTDLEADITLLESEVDDVQAQVTDLGTQVAGFDGRIDTLEDLTTTGRLSPDGVEGTINAVLATKDFPLNVKDYGAVGDGIASDSAAIKAAILAAPEGGYVLIPPGTYKLTSQIDNTVSAGVYKAVNILAEGARFVKEHNGFSVVFRSGFDTPYNVTAISTGRISENDDNSIVDTTILTLAAGPAPAWKRGDLVKVVADDGVPYSENSDSPTLNKNRVGQHLTVVSVVGSTVTLAGDLVDTYTLNIRVAKMRTTRSSWTGGTFDVSDAHIAAGYEVNTIALDGAYMPRIQNVVVQRSTGSGISMIGCFGTSIDNFTAGWFLNWPNGGHSGYGYGISDSASQGTRITNSYFSQVRHAYTTGSVDRPANDSFQWYGRPYQVIISNCFADSCTSSGWDTHEGAMEVKFDNVTAANCTIGFGTRSVYVTMVNITTRDCDTGIRQFDVGGDSRAFGLVVDGWTSIDDTLGFESFIGERVGSDMYHIVDPGMNYVRNANLRVKKRGFVLRWGKYTLSNMSIVYTESDDSSSNAIVASHVIIQDMVLDYREATGMVPAALEVVAATEASTILNIEGMLVKGTLSSRINNLVNHPSNLSAGIRDVLLDGLPAGNVHGSFTVASFFDWECRNGNQANSGVVQLTNTGSLPNTSHRDSLVAIFTLTSNRTYGTFGNPGRTGQIVVISNSSTSAGNLTLLNSALVQLIGGVDKVMTPGSTATFMTLPGSVWKEI